MHLHDLEGRKEQTRLFLSSNAFDLEITKNGMTFFSKWLISIETCLFMSYNSAIFE